MTSAAACDVEGGERRKLTAILTDQRAQAIITPPPVDPPAPTKRGWWRIGGRAAAK